MNNKRSYLENINAGRRRRPRANASLDEISRTLEEMEHRLGRATGRFDQQAEENEVARRIQELSETVSQTYARPGERPAPHRHKVAPQAYFERAAHELERSHRQEREVSSIGSIASELKTLRSDLRDAMRSGLNDEFTTLRRELAGIMASVPNSALSSELVVEFERLSNAIAQLAERSDDKNVKMLRLEMEELKSSISNLAREETLRAVDQRWDALDDRWSAFETRVSNDIRRSDPAIEMLHQRIEEIAHAVNSLPESLSIQSLEDRVRTLAGALDQLLERKQQSNPEVYAALDERLDEISRAIAASAPKAQAASFDPQPFERIEARISSLASQVSELLSERSGGEAVGQLSEQLYSLSQRVDDIARRIDMPEQTVERLAGQIAGIAEKLDTAPQPQPQIAEHMLRGIEDRFAHLSQLIEERQGDVAEQGRTLVDELERRLQEISARIDERGNPAHAEAGLMATIDARFNELAARLDVGAGENRNGEALRALEARLDDISGRLQASSSQASSVDPEVIRNLEAQVRSLSEHLSRPGADLPEFEDLGPRLENIERSIHENRAAVVEAARHAAEQAIGALGNAPQAEAFDRELRAELRALEELTRKSDERNTKTFEAIHDTLLKIVDRIGAVESTSKASAGSGAAKIAVAAAPSISPAGDEAVETVTRDYEPAPNRSPAEAAAAAARAALDEDGQKEQVKPGRTSLLGGLSRAWSTRGEKQQADVEEDIFEETELEADGSLEAVELDAERINEPLEPGSGAPDLNAILRRVRDEKKAPVRSETDDAAKSDFIAAARRAAQAAAAEAEILKKRRSEATEETGRFGLGRLLKRSRKPLMVMLGAGIVAAGGYQVGKAYLSNSTSIPMPVASDSSAPEPAAVVAGTSSKAEDRRVRVVDEQPLDGSTPNQAVDETVDTLASMPQMDAPAQGKFEEPLSTTETASLPEAPPVEAVQTVSLDEIPMDAGPIPLREAAAGGDPKAYFEIASRYAEGRGTTADMAKAVEWYTKAAEAGFAPAQYRVGDLYQKGTGVERDAAKAKMWFQLAAQQGNAGAMHNLGVLYAMGADGPADNGSAARWFLEAAEHGVKDSQFNLGILSAKGMGVPQDLTEAYKWFAIVANGGDRDAASKRDEIAAALSPEKLEQAKNKTALWKAKSIDPAVNMVDVPESWRESRELTASVDMKKAVTNIQLILNQQGFDAGKPDGIMGARTKTAISAFQKANGMTPTGEVDEALVRALLEKNKAAAAAQ
ncbi:SEL1-like repeat protein [Nitratireductor sp. L1-7-SE]|uniref:SEL1-like repeat protein n=1 Tax=Nitratireductor rhodophyticola TaxID=2854036 RepID=A0ABS7R897_9HYPH|nr:peptidoglycan-binding protein [Nitratireductor rhodophyticola]MBY8917147.1 SEL1-like repeat protein [Nitratireductor rhodophyticola]MBY8920424.1 SEL1-like repeat protein [Nitratireductor rhodophyticola]